MDRIGQKKPLKWFLREWRQHKNLSQDAVAGRMDTNKGQISKLERGEQRMNDYWIAAYANALGVDPAALLHHPDKPTLDDLLRTATSDQISELRSIAEVILRRKAG